MDVLQKRDRKKLDERLKEMENGILYLLVVKIEVCINKKSDKAVCSAKAGRYSELPPIHDAQPLDTVFACA